jgi:accessory colonization factor AcfC
VRRPVTATLTALLLAVPAAATAEAPVRVYGPGGPEPALREIAQAYERSTGVKVQMVAGPMDKWIARAREDADLVYSGSEYMMIDFVNAMDGKVDADSVSTLYLRPSAILVRPGNPRGLKGLPDLAAPGLKVMVVQGAGQVALWEDMAGRGGDVRLVRALRRNIVLAAPSGDAARKAWAARRDLDAWITFDVWQVADPAAADLVPVSAEHVIHRSVGVALTRKGLRRPAAVGLARFLEGPEAAAIFRRWGWTVP